MRIQPPSLYESRKRITKSRSGGADLKKQQGRLIVFMLMQYESFGLTQQFKEEFGIVPVVWRNPFE